MKLYQALDAEIDGVRHQLDNLADLRYLTGLSLAEGDRYHELCRRERALLPLSAQGQIPNWLSYMDRTALVSNVRTVNHGLGASRNS